jgi:microcystin-dependent protein
MFPVPFLKRNLLALLLLCWLGTPGRCQIGIDEPNPDQNSVLDIKSETKGILLPRLTTGKRESLGSAGPGNSMLVFDLNENQFFYYSTPFGTWFSLLAVQPGPGWSTYTGNLELIGNVKASKFEGDGVIPAGGIIMWSGAVGTIPTGWVLCDGRNNTPNLTDKFIVGAGGTYNPGNTGGNATITLTEGQLPSHTHAITSDGTHSHTVNSAYVGGAQADQGQKGRFILESHNYEETTSADGAHNHGGAVGATGRNEAVGILPPYYALAFIMKL